MEGVVKTANTKSVSSLVYQITEKESERYFLHVLNGKRAGIYEFTEEFRKSLDLYSLIESGSELCVAIDCDNMSDSIVGSNPIHTFNLVKASRTIRGLLELAQFADKICLQHRDSSVWIKHRVIRTENKLFDISYDHLDKVGTAFYQEGKFVSEDEAVKQIEKIYPGHQITITYHCLPSSYLGFDHDGQYAFTMTPKEDSR